MNDESVREKERYEAREKKAANVKARQEVIRQITEDRK